MAIILPLLSTFNAAGIKAAQGQLMGLGKSLKGLVGPATAATLGVQALQGAVRFAGEAVSEARDLERNMAAMGTVFDGLQPRMKTFVDNAYKMGLSQVEAARTSTFLGSVLKQAGLPMDQVATKTEELTVLAQDLATTYGYDTSEALTAMTALFRGEYDPIEKFGVALKQNEVNALVAAKGLGHLTGQEMLNAQQTVRMEQLFLRSADAAGAFARQSGTLFVEQKKLTAVFDNMQAAVGSELTPALAGLMQQLTPVVNNLTPALTESFRIIGDIIGDLTPVIEPVAGILIDLLDTVNLLGSALADLVSAIAPGLVDAFTAIENLVSHIANGIEELVDLVDDLRIAWESLPEGPALNWLMDVYNLVNKVSGVLNPVANLLFRLSALGNANDGKSSPILADETSRLMRRRLESLGAIGVSEDKGKGKGTKDAVAEFYKNIADEMAKQSAMLKLKKLGLSEALIDSVVGSGSDWQKVFTKIKGLSKDALSKLQADFRKTAAGQKEIADLRKQLEDDAEERFKVAMDQYNDQLRIFEAQRDAINALKRSLNEAAQATIPLAVATREIGQFESATISAFDNIASVIANALADGTLLKSAADNLTAYANKEKSVIADLMRQRDAVANKRSLASAMLEDVRASVVGMQNITNILANQAGDITQSVTKMVGTVQVTTSKVIKGIVGGGAKELVASFGDIVAKTKTFANQLKELRALGLNKNLYQQIVDAGIDAGGTTAKAILEGGAGTVGELNTLFEELDVAGQEIAKNSAEVMFGAGVDLTNGLINGLISQEQQLVDTATRLAEAFTTAFNAQVSVQVPMPSAPIMPTKDIIPDVTVPNVTVPKATTAKKVATTNITNNVVLKPAAGIVTKKDGIAVARAIQIATKAGTLTRGGI